MLQPRFVLIPVLVCLYLAGYLVAMRFVPWLELLSPRGGIVGFAVYLLVAAGLVHVGEQWTWLSGSHRLQLKMGGWLLLMMPPVWVLVHFLAS